MNKLAKHVGMGLLLCSLLAGLAACGQKEGPAEKTGKAVDSAVGTVGQKIEQAGEGVQDAAKGDDK